MKYILLNTQDFQIEESDDPRTVNPNLRVLGTTNDNSKLILERILEYFQSIHKKPTTSGGQFGPGPGQR